MQSKNPIALIPNCSYCGHFNPNDTHCGLCRRRLRMLYDNNTRNTPTQPRPTRLSGFPRATVVSPSIANKAVNRSWRRAQSALERGTKLHQAIDQLLSE